MWRSRMRQCGLPSALAAGQADEDGRRGDADRDHRIGEAGAEKGGQRDRQDEERHREHGVGDAHEQAVDPAPGVAGEQPDGHAEGERDRDRDETGEERGAGTVDHARQDVPADLVGAEEVRRARRLAHQEEVGRLGTVGSEQGRKSCRRDEEQNHDRAEDGAPAPDQPAHRLAERAPRRAVFGLD